MGADQQGQLALEEFLVAQVQFHQAAQVADGVEVDVLAFEAEQAVASPGQADLHADQYIQAQVQAGLEGPLRVAVPVLRLADQDAVQGDVVEQDLPAPFALEDLAVGVEGDPVETSTFVVLETHMSQSLFSLAFGVGTQNRQEAWLEVFYALPLLKPSSEIVAAVAPILGYAAGNQALTFTSQQAYQLADALKGIDAAQSALLSRLAESQKPLVATLLAEDAAPSSTAEAYLKLHLLSHRLVKPHAVNLSGIFPLLPNVAWTNIGAVDLAELAELQLEARLKGKLLEVFSVDKFPKMTDYVVPAGVRIADTARVRLGAYIGEGTTVMHEGFVNFNAGTEGPGMIEGRVSAGVFVGKGSDLGGGCSTMGTLSGGGNIVISVGEGCLIGANAGIGIPLGDRNIVEAGLYITAGTKVALLDEQNALVKVVKARDLAGQPDLLFRRNSQNGAVECKTNKTAIELNEALHAHN